MVARINAPRVLEDYIRQSEQLFTAALEVKAKGDTILADPNVVGYAEWALTQPQITLLNQIHTWCANREAEIQAMLEELQEI